MCVCVDCFQVSHGMILEAASSMQLLEEELEDERRMEMSMFEQMSDYTVPLSGCGNQHPSSTKSNLSTHDTAAAGASIISADTGSELTHGSAVVLAGNMAAALRQRRGNPKAMDDADGDHSSSSDKDTQDKMPTRTTTRQQSGEEDKFYVEGEVVLKADTPALRGSKYSPTRKEKNVRSKPGSFAESETVLSGELLPESEPNVSKSMKRSALRDSNGSNNNWMSGHNTSSKSVKESGVKEGVKDGDHRQSQDMRGSLASSASWRSICDEEGSETVLLSPSKSTSTMNNDRNRPMMSFQRSSAYQDDYYDELTCSPRRSSVSNTTTTLCSPIPQKNPSSSNLLMFNKDNSDSSDDDEIYHRHRNGRPNLSDNSFLNKSVNKSLSSNASASKIDTASPSSANLKASMKQQDVTSLQDRMRSMKLQKDSKKSYVWDTLLGDQSASNSSGTDSEAVTGTGRSFTSTSHQIHWKRPYNEEDERSEDGSENESDDKNGPKESILNMSTGSAGSGLGLKPSASAKVRSYCILLCCCSVCVGRVASVISFCGIV